MDEYFMRLAIEEARQAFRKGKLPVGSVIVIENKVVGQGHRLSKRYHAETIALLRAVNRGYPAPAMTVYTTLEPCFMCVGNMAHLKVGKIVFALEDPYGGAAFLLPAAEEIERHKDKIPRVGRGILREEALELFAEFFRTTDDPFWRNLGNSLVRLCLEGM